MRALWGGCVQRWDVGGGYTFWVRALALPSISDPGTPGHPDDPTAPTTPGNSVAPVISETSGGTALLCSSGTWSGGTASFGFQWFRDGVRVTSVSGSTYSLGGADDGTEIVCRVTATTPPANPCVGAASVSIAGGAAYVRRPQVTLTVVVPADATGIEVSNTAAFTTPTTVARSAGCAVAWTLTTPTADATPIGVYVRWIGGTTAGQGVTDAVRFDRTGPRIADASVRFSAKKWLLRVTASDVSGIATITYGHTRTSGLRTVAAASAVRVPAPEAARWVRVSDRLGNVGAWLHVS